MPSFAKAQPSPLPAEYLSESKLNNDLQITRKIERNPKIFAGF
jgi:hypothetical protein